MPSTRIAIARPGRALVILLAALIFAGSTPALATPTDPMGPPPGSNALPVKGLVDEVARYLGVPGCPPTPCDALSHLPGPSTTPWISIPKGTGVPVGGWVYADNQEDSKVVFVCAAPGFVDCSGAAGFAVKGCVTIPVVEVVRCVSATGGIVTGFSSISVLGGGVDGYIMGREHHCTWGGGSGACIEDDTSLMSGCQAFSVIAMGYLYPHLTGPIAQVDVTTCDAVHTLLGLGGSSTAMDARAGMIKDLDEKTARLTSAADHLPESARGEFLAKVAHMHNEMKAQIDSLNDEAFNQQA